MVSMDTVRIVCSAVCVAEKPGGRLDLLPAPPAVHIAMDRPAGQRVQPVSKQRNRGTTPAFAARQALPTTAWLPGPGFPHAKRAAQGTCVPQHDRPEGTGRGAGSAACAGTRGFGAAKSSAPSREATRDTEEAAFGPADLMLSGAQGIIYLA